MFTTGVASISFRNASVDQIIAAAAAARLDGIEWGSDVHVPAGDEALAREVRQKTEAAGLRVLSYGGYYRLGASQKPKEELKRLLDSAKALGVKDVRIWAGDRPAGQYTGAQWQALVNEARAAAAMAVQYGMVLSLECHPHTVTENWADTLRFLQEVSSPAMESYWQPNQYKSEEYNLKAARSLVEFVTNVHVFSWQQDTRLPLEEHTEIWMKYLRLLSNGRPHALILEFMPDDKLETLSDAAAVLRDWAGKFEPQPAAAVSPLCLLPQPQKLVLHEGWTALDKEGILLLDDCTLYPAVRLACRRFLSKAKIVLGSCAGQAQVRLKKATGLPAEGYRLQIDDIAEIEYADTAGAFYAMQTLNGLFELDAARLPHVYIEDWPSFPVRGYMLDIGRNKVPKIEEIFRLVDRLAAWKINHLELYIEGVPFCYQSFPQMWQGHELMTGEDILRLDAYCRERFIELVPTQNNFGHMDVWLKKEFRTLAECPDGFTFGQDFLPDPRCLNPFDARSLELVRHLADDLLPYFSSEKYNVCCDETLELGQGASKTACEAQGRGRVYVDFLLKIIAEANRRGRRALVWDDIIKEYPELLGELPAGTTLLDWGYSAAAPHAADCSNLQKSGVDFYVCPGTAAWNCYLGKTDQMQPNIARAGRLGLKYGAKGLLNTDWGDGGHLQSISSSLAGIAYGAAVAWCPETNTDIDLAEALDAHVFYDRNRCMGHFVLQAGRYERYEGKTQGNVSMAFWFLFRQDPATVTEMDPVCFDEVTEYLESLRPLLEGADMQCSDARLIREEYHHVLHLVETMQLYGKACKARQLQQKEEELCWLTALVEELPPLELEARRVWLARNLQSWMEESMQQYRTMLTGAVVRLQELTASAEKMS